MLISALRILAIFAVSAIAGIGSAVGVRGLDLFPNVPKITSREAKIKWIKEQRAIELDDFRAFYQGGGLVIDARPESEFLKGHLDAIMIRNVPVGEAANRMERIAPFMSQTVVIYCTSLECHLAEDLYIDELEPMGFTDMRVFLPGWDDGVLKFKLPTASGPEPAADNANRPVDANQPTLEQQPAANP